jgi:hypothetical protein
VNAAKEGVNENCKKFGLHVHGITRKEEKAVL